MIYFVSGHLDLTEAEFKSHYERRILKAVEDGVRVDAAGLPYSRHSFVVGDARGADYLAQRFLVMFAALDNTTVYHMLDEPRNHFLAFKTVGGFTSDKERDAAMTAASDADIAWVRPGREKSGTAKNLARRSNLLASRAPAPEPELFVRGAVTSETFSRRRMAKKAMELEKDEAPTASRPTGKRVP